MPKMPETTEKRIQVWDIPTRAFHWLLVTLFAVAWVSSEGKSVFLIHEVAGYGVLVLLLFRFAWGFLGSEHARWRAFLRGPTAVREYLVKVAALRPPHHVGHNPAGGWMIVALLATLATVVVSGLFASDDGIGGPFAGAFGEFLSDIHGGLANIVMTLVVVHVAGVLVESALTGENLTAAMWRGWKRWPHPHPANDARMVPMWRALLAAAASAGFVWWLVAR